MSKTLETMTADLTRAMKAKDEATRDTLRQVIGAVRSSEKAGKVARVFTEEEVLNLLAKESKKRKETADIYLNAGHQARAEHELKEASVIDAYLPEPLSDSELTRLVEEAVKSTGADSPRMMGQVIKAVNAAAQGRADGKRVSTEVKRQLA